MSEFKGTKGKWEEINIQLYDWSNCSVAVDKGQSICTMYYEGVNIPDETKANALLISKAPDMLEMLKEIITDWEVGNEDNFIMANNIDKAKKLIKEATEL